MDKMNLNGEGGHKRKAKKRCKEKKWKRSKFTKSTIFQEANFDSSEDDSAAITNVKLRPEKFTLFASQFSKILNLSPSKSELDVSVNIPSSDSDSSIVYGTTNSSFNFIENNLKTSSSEEENSYPHGSVVDEFMDTSRDNNAEIVSAIVVKKIAKKGKTRIDSSEKKAKDGQNEKPKMQIAQQNGLNKNVQYHHTTDGIIVVLKRGETVYIRGLCLLSVLHGQIEILGHVININSPEAKFYSPRGSALLYLKNVTNSDIPATNYLLNLKISNRVILTEKCAVFFCKQLHDPNIRFIEKHISQQIFPKEGIRDLPQIIFDPNEGNLIKTDPRWNEIIDTIRRCTKMIICGGKGVGKTTFLRYAINRLLMKYKEIRVVDLDPGQSEFSVPGCISVVRVTKPVFGASYTHLQPTERSILSNINIAYEPDKYVASVKLLLDTRMDGIPTLINYMGYTHDIGINILSAVIIQVEPTDVLQICSRDSKKNYKYILETNVIVENAQLFVPSKNLNYKLHKIESLSDENNGWTAEPRQLREMCLLAYLREMIDSDSIFRTKVALYRICLDDIKLTDLRGDGIHPAAINASLVALCKMRSNELGIFECLGWGIIRGIDLISNYLILLSSVDLEILDNVSHLVLSGATLPPSIYMTPDDVTGPMPYVIKGILMSFGQIPKRSRISVK